MKKLSLIGACAVILFFVVGVGTPAAAPVEQGLVEYTLCRGRDQLSSLVYDGNTVPEDSLPQQWAVWEGTQRATWDSDGQMLSIDAYDEVDELNGAAIFYRAEESLATADTFSIEVTAKLGQYRPKGEWELFPPPYLAFGVSDGVKAAVMWTCMPLDGRVCVNYLPDPHGSEPNVTNWFELNTYRLVVDKSHPDPALHRAHVYVNDTLVLSVPYNELPDFSPAFPNVPDTPYLFAFGVNSSETVWDQIAYQVCGPPIYTAAIAEILAFFDEAVADGRLEGVRSPLQLQLMRTMIELAGKPDNIAGVCSPLQRAYERTDGLSPPPDLVEGPAAPELAEMIMDLMVDLGCR